MFGLQSNLIKLGSWLNLIQLEKNFTTLDNAASRTKSTPADDDSVDGDDNDDDNEKDDDDEDDNDDNDDDDDDGGGGGVVLHIDRPPTLLTKDLRVLLAVSLHACSDKADSTLRSSQAVPHPSTNRALCRLTSEVRRDPVHSTWYGRQQLSIYRL